MSDLPERVPLSAGVPAQAGSQTGLCPFCLLPGHDKLHCWRRRLYVPTPKQERAHSARRQWVGFGGGRGGAKSRWIIEDGNNLARRICGIRLKIFRANLDDLKETTLDEWRRSFLCDDKRPWSQFEYINWTELLFRYRPCACHGLQSEMSFGHLQDDMGLLSLTLGGFYLEQAEEVKESLVTEFLIPTLRQRRQAETARP